jgi:RNA polymerase sigma factor (sigma-70 family)
MPNEGLFADFVRDRGPALYRYGYLLTGNHHDADDLVQDALIKLRSRWSRVVRQDDPIGYVRTTMARLHISAWRRRRETPRAALPEEPVADRALDRVETSARSQEIWAALATLPPRQRAEIAAVLGVSHGTVRGQASRALARLRITGIAALEGVTS